MNALAAPPTTVSVAVRDLGVESSRGGYRVPRPSTPACEYQDPRGGARRPDRSELGDAGEEPVGLGSVPTVQLTEQLRIDPASFFRRGPSADLQGGADQSGSDDEVPQLHGRR